jgi:hypothetical protein
MQWLFENKCPWDHHTFTYAARHGILENMQWFSIKNVLGIALHLQMLQNTEIWKICSGFSTMDVLGDLIHLKI